MDRLTPEQRHKNMIAVKSKGTGIENLLANDTYSDYWRFLSKYLPNYSNRDDVLMSDILFRYCTGEYVCSDDIEYIEQNFANKEEVLEECINMEKRFFNEAITNYYLQTVK